MPKTRRCGTVLTITLDFDAMTALRLMAPGPKILGRFLSGLVMQEAARREQRAQSPEGYAQMLREMDETHDSVALVG